MGTTAAPLFEGRKIAGIALKLTGAIEEPQAQPPRRLELGEEIDVVVRGTVTKISHDEKDGNVIRVHTLKLAEAYEVEDETLGLAREMAAIEYDKAIGQGRLDGKA